MRDSVFFVKVSNLSLHTLTDLPLLHFLLVVALAILCRQLLRSRLIVEAWSQSPRPRSGLRVVV